MSTLPSPGGLDVIYQQLVQQATMLSFNDVFAFLTVMMILILPLVLLIKKGEDDISVPRLH
jgi:DHA2 family multidrug resistance protein